MSWAPGPDGVPLLPGTPAILAGVRDDVITSGDHVIVLLDVDHVHLKPTKVPALSFYRGRFVAPTGPTEYGSQISVRGGCWTGALIPTAAVAYSTGRRLCCRI